MSDQHIEILKDNRSAYAWLLAIVALAIGLGLWFSPKADQPLFVWLLVAIISLPATLLFLLGTFTSYFDLKVTNKGITFGGYSGRRKYNWEEITKIAVTGGDECPRITFSLTPTLKDEVEYSRQDEVLPKLYGNTPKELRAKLRKWQRLALEQSGKTVARSRKDTCNTLFSPEAMTKKERLKTGLQFIMGSFLLMLLVALSAVAVGQRSRVLPLLVLFLMALFLLIEGIRLIVWKFWK